MLFFNMNDQHIITANFSGNPNVGLYTFCAEEYCLISTDVPTKMMKILKSVLKVPVYQISIAGTSLIGAFLAGNKNMLLVPSITFDHELDKLKELGIAYTVFHSDITALGNNILVNDSGCLVSKDFSEDEIQQIQQAFNVPTKTGKLADLPNVGSLGIVTNKGGLFGQNVEEFEIEFVETLLKIKEIGRASCRERV